MGLDTCAGNQASNLKTDEKIGLPWVSDVGIKEYK